MKQLKIKKLTIQKAIELVAQINDIQDDDELAHIKEDDFREWFIECCAKGLYTKKETIEISEIVLKTNDLDFSRWCA